MWGFKEREVLVPSAVMAVVQLGSTAWAVRRARSRWERARLMWSAALRRRSSGWLLLWEEVTEEEENEEEAEGKREECIADGGDVAVVLLSADEEGEEERSVCATCMPERESRARMTKG